MHISLKSVLLVFSLIMASESSCSATQFIHSLSTRPAVKTAVNVLSTVTDFGLLGFSCIFAYNIMIKESHDDKGKAVFWTTLSLGLLYLKKSYALERAVKALHKPTENQTEQTA